MDLQYRYIFNFFVQGIAEEEEKIVVIEDVDVNIWEVWTKVLELMKEENINQYRYLSLKLIRLSFRYRVYVITLYVAWNI